MKLGLKAAIKASGNTYRGDNSHQDYLSFFHSGEVILIKNSYFLFPTRGGNSYQEKNCLLFHLLLKYRISFLSKQKQILSLKVTPIQMAQNLLSLWK